VEAAELKAFIQHVKKEYGADGISLADCGSAIATIAQLVTVVFL
jgi:hypothetical protein